LSKREICVISGLSVLTWNFARNALIVVLVQTMFLGRQRIDDRLEDALLDRDIGFPVLFMGDDHLVIAEDESFQEIPQLRVGCRDVDMAAPHPWLSLPAELYEGKRLGIVDDHAIVVDHGIGGEILVGLEVQILLHAGQVDVLSLYTVVKLLRDFKKIGCPADDPPIRVDARIVHKRNEAAEYFGDAASRVRRIDVDDSLPIESPGLLIDVVDRIIPYDGAVIMQSSHGTLLPTCLISFSLPGKKERCTEPRSPRFPL